MPAALAIVSCGHVLRSGVLDVSTVVVYSTRYSVINLSLSVARPLGPFLPIFEAVP